MNFSTFTLPNDQSWYVSDSNPLMKEFCPEVSGPLVQHIPDSFMHALCLIQIEKNLSMEEAFHYMAHLSMEHLGESLK
jgi:hypothetical protein